jgi:hypothetical protein
MFRGATTHLPSLDNNNVLATVIRIERRNESTTLGKTGPCQSPRITSIQQSLDMVGLFPPGRSVRLVTEDASVKVAMEHLDDWASHGDLKLMEAARGGNTFGSGRGTW